MQLFRRSTGWTLILGIAASFIAPIQPLQAETLTSANSAAYWSRQLAALPSRWAVVEDVHDSRPQSAPSDYLNRPDRTLLLLQDSPENAALQERIGKILRRLAVSSEVRLVLVEGAEGDVTIPLAGRQNGSAERSRVLRSWVRSFRLSGPESAQLLSRRSIRLVGVDNADLFDRTVQIFLRLETMRERARHHLKGLGLTVAFLSRAIAADQPSKLEMIQSTLRNLAAVALFLDSEPGSAGAEAANSMLGRYRAASTTVNRLVRQVGLGDTGMFFDEPVFQKIEVFENKLRELSQQRDLELVRRVLEAMDERQASVAALVIRENRLDEVASQFQKSGVSFVRVRPTAAGIPDLDQYAAELRQQFASSPILRQAAQSDRHVYLSHLGNPLRTLPLMARAPSEMARRQRPEVAKLAGELGAGGRAARTDPMAQALSAALRNIKTRDNASSPVLPPATGAGNAQIEIETAAMPDFVAGVAPQPAVASEPRNTDEENRLRRQAFVLHLKSLESLDKNRHAADDPQALPKPEADVLRDQFVEYARDLQRLWDGGKDRLYQKAEAWILKLPVIGAAFSARSATQIWKGLWEDPQAWSDFLSLAGRWGWVRQPRLLPSDMTRVRTDHERLAAFMTHNNMQAGLPKSYQSLPGFWKEAHTAVDSAEQIDEVLERLISENCLLIYDGAVWQIALALVDPKRFSHEIHRFNEVLLEGRLGDLETIRAWKDPYRYGDEEIPLPKENAYFFRLISDRYVQKDEMTGLKQIENFPNHSFLHHEDWKPITGEQAWAAILGPLHSAYLSGDLKRRHPDALKLAASLLPAFEAMASPVGAIYHAPHGTHGKSGFDISNENNFSVLAALRILRKELIKKGDLDAASRASGLIAGILSYFKQYAFDAQSGVFFQGGFYLDNQFVPSQVFAVDCQTWGIAALGPEWIDEQFGEGASYRIWQITRRRAGYFNDSGQLEGIGFTDQDRVLSVEWTAGAVLACRMMAIHYAESHPQWAKDLESDSIRMRLGIDRYRIRLQDGSEAYLYSNRRFFIPFGWWANPLPSLVSTAWVILLDKQYNPFWPEGVYPPEDSKPKD